MRPPVRGLTPCFSRVPITCVRKLSSSVWGFGDLRRELLAQARQFGDLQSSHARQVRSESLAFGERVGQLLRLSFRIGTSTEQRNLRGLHDVLLGPPGDSDGRERLAIAGPVHAVPISQKAFVIRVLSGTPERDR